MRLRFTDSRSKELWACLQLARISLVVVPEVSVGIRSRTLDQVARHHRVPEPHVFLYVMDCPASTKGVEVWIIETEGGWLITATSATTWGRIVALMTASLNVPFLYLGLPPVLPRHTPTKALLRFVLGMPFDALYDVPWRFAMKGPRNSTALYLWQS